MPDPDEMSPESGKMYDQSGDVVWTADLLSGTSTAVSADNPANNMSPSSGKVFGPDGSIHWMVDLLTPTPESFNYLGSWDASTNDPTIADGTGTNGDMYKVSVAGSQDLGSGSITFAVGDHVVYDGTTWENFGAGDAVSSVNGQTGVVNLTASDVGAVAPGDLADVATSGAYGDLTGAPINRTSGTVQLILSGEALIWPNDVQNGKIRLYNSTPGSDNTFYGIGIANGEQVYQVDSNTSKHVFQGVDGSDNALTIAEMSSDGGIVASVDMKVESADPQFELHRTGASANEGRWNWSTDPDQLSLTAVSDDGNTVGTAWLLTRSGASVTAHSFHVGADSYLSISNASDITASVDLHMSEQKIVNLGNGSSARDAVNKQQLDEKLTASQVAHMDDSIATDVQGIVANYNALLQNMIAAGVMAGS